MPSNYSVDTSIRTSVKTLISDWRELNDAYEDFARKKLLFAQRIKHIWDKAKQLDGKLKQIKIKIKICLLY